MVSDYDLIGSAAEGIGNGIDKTAHGVDKIWSMFGLSHRVERRAYGKSLKQEQKDYERLYGSGMTERMKNVLWAAYVNDLHKLGNFYDVLEMVERIRNDGDVTETMPNQDWLDSFRDIAERTNQEAKQLLLAKVLSGEISKPGAISKRTLATLDTLSTLEARRFTRLCSWCADIPSADDSSRLVPVPMLAQENEDGETRGGIPLQEVRILEDAGLTTQTFSYKFIFKPGRNPIYVGGQERFVDNSSDEQRGFLPGYGLTTTGEELSRLCIRGTAEADIAGIISARLESLAWKTATPKIRRKQQ
jgi:hypothetical protein